MLQYYAIVIVTSTVSCYCYNVLLCACLGAKGDTGAAGLPGFDGLKGNAGQPGNPGQRGDPGVEGITIS